MFLLSQGIFAKDLIKFEKDLQQIEKTYLPPLKKLSANDKIEIEQDLSEIRKLLKIPLKEIKNIIRTNSFNKLNELIENTERDLNFSNELKTGLAPLKTSVEFFQTPGEKDFYSLIETLNDQVSNVSQIAQNLTADKFLLLKALKTKINEIKIKDNLIHIPLREISQKLELLEKETISNRNSLTSISDLKNTLIANYKVNLSENTSFETIKRDIQIKYEKVFSDYHVATNNLIRKFSNSFSQHLGYIEKDLEADLEEKIREFSKKIKLRLEKYLLLNSRLSLSDANIIGILNHLPLLEQSSWTSSNPIKQCEFGFGNSQAETNCDYYLDIRSGVEFIGDNDFEDSFPRIELRLLWRIFESREFESYWKRKKNDTTLRESKKAPDGTHELFSPWRFQLNANGALTSRNQESATTGPGGLTTISGTKALEGNIGLQVDFLDIYRRDPWGTYNPTFTFAVLAEAGFFDPQDEIVNTDGDILKTHFAGLRLYYRGQNILNGASLDFGWRFNEAFDKQDPRTMFRGYIPFRITETNTKVFGAIETDTGDGRDEIKLILGLSIPLDRVAGSIKSLFIKEESTSEDK